MTKSAPNLTTIGNQIPIRFSGGIVTFVGSVLHDPSTGLLVLDTGDGEPEEYLSISLAAYGIWREADEVFVKDWSEGNGIAQSLVDAGPGRDRRRAQRRILLVAGRAPAHSPEAGELISITEDDEPVPYQENPQSIRETETQRGFGGGEGQAGHERGSTELIRVSFGQHTWSG
ncbi:hypothetical protein F1D05_09960 [Kribbella qitaiheensis]|uniref:Uncharacterized protein n=1 Tax=Kribbella qitaiheensis TaxID=1544730 RepID=A0A7G6WVZ2_9ACTN|nr:hypothetical protein [Kribbella qitaiheensis]QNE18157.1 hypothetical protein F1D05_09960 [Kribbella qitaiheensis]